MIKAVVQFRKMFRSRVSDSPDLPHLQNQLRGALAQTLAYFRMIIENIQFAKVPYLRCVGKYNLIFNGDRDGAITSWNDSLALAKRCHMVWDEGNVLHLLANYSDAVSLGGRSRARSGKSKSIQSRKLTSKRNKRVDSDDGSHNPYDDKKKSYSIGEQSENNDDDEEDESWKKKKMTGVSSGLEQMRNSGLDRAMSSPNLRPEGIQAGDEEVRLFDILEQLSMSQREAHLAWGF